MNFWRNLKEKTGLGVGVLIGLAGLILWVLICALEGVLSIIIAFSMHVWWKIKLLFNI